MLEKIDETNYRTLIMGLVWWFMLWGARKLVSPPNALRIVIDG